MTRGAVPPLHMPRQFEMRPRHARDAHAQTEPPFPGWHRLDRLRANRMRASAAAETQTRLLGHPASRRVRGAPVRKRTRPRIPTTPAWRNPAPQATATAGSILRQRVTARSLKNPRISPALPALLKESFHDRSTTFATRQLLGKEGPWQGSTTRPYSTLTHKSCQPTTLFALAAASHCFKTSDGPPAVDDQDRGAPFQTINQRTEPIFGLRDTDLFHKAKIAFWIALFKSVAGLL